MKKVILVIAVVLIVIQFFRIDKENPPAEINKDFINLTDPPQEIAEMIKTSCYDCHSYHTRYPWYSDIAPASWLLKNHVNDGRDHLNFSIWPDYKESKKEHKIGECIEVVESGEMPMKGYILFHSEADLNETQRHNLISWFQSVKDSLSKSN
jgi:hypothetical protein